ncbi:MULTISPECIES: DUF4041 domain-containing protein [Actinomycetes]|uniref:Bacteriophage T5 Orf172 DNA-binding domain-containing protein n=2 Tax=Actinomycetes TaxID=1760 RepID=A0ABP6LRF4_9MICC
MEQTGQASVQPLGRSRSTYTFMMTLLGITLLPVVTIPFVVPAMIYMSRLRRQAVQAHEASESAHARNLWVESEVQRLGVMDHIRRRDELVVVQRQIQTANAAVEAKARELDAVIADKHHELENLEAVRRQDLEALDQRMDERRAEVAKLKDEVLVLNEAQDVQDYGLYDFENPAEDSVRLSAQLSHVRAEIKAMVKDKSATTADSGWTVNHSVSKGRKMVADMSKLLLRAYNAEAENAIKTVKAGNLTTAVKRLDRSAEAVARLGKMMGIRITHRYAHLRRQELELTHQHLESVRAAKEEEREVRRREREEAQAQKEFLALKAKQEKEVAHYRNVLLSLRESGQTGEAEKVTLALQQAEEKLADVERTMANTRAGYVYVISNRGAFGEKVVKIGMTRRLNPDDRIRELSDASVPFNFDKHTMIFSEDAVGLESALHRHFADRRVNLINMRREYFYATPGQVRDALVAHDVQVLEFHEGSEAAEYEASQLKRRQQHAPANADLRQS